jgi:hypothetical protein
MSEVDEAEFKLRLDRAVGYMSAWNIPKEMLG